MARRFRPHPDQLAFEFPEVPAIRPARVRLAQTSRPKPKPAPEPMADLLAEPTAQTPMPVVPASAPEPVLAASNDPRETLARHLALWHEAGRPETRFPDAELDRVLRRLRPGVTRDGQIDSGRVERVLEGTDWNDRWDGWLLGDDV